MPDTGADTEQVVNTVAALTRRRLSMELLLPGAVTGAGDAAALCDYYHVTGDFPLHLLKWHWHGLRGLEKWSFALRAPSHPAARAADLVYTRNLPGAWCMLRAGHRVVYEHFRPWGDQYPPLQPILRGILRHPRLIGAVFHSQHALESYRRLGIAEERMLVAHNGWDPARMEPRMSRTAARALLGLPAEPFTVVYSGRMNLRKGLDIVLDAARAAPELRFVLVGSEEEGPVEAQARPLPNVQVVGWQRSRDLAPWLYAADVLLIPPSLAPLQQHGNTVLPIKLFLYLAAGRALLAPALPDTAELLTDDVNAVLVPPGDVTATIAALRALAADAGRRERIAQAALASATDLTWDARATRIERFLRARLSSPPAPPPKGNWTVSKWLRDTFRWGFGLK